MKKLLAVLALSALAGACSSSNPVEPSAAKPVQGKVSNSRYILISNAYPPNANCYDGGNGYWVCP